MGLKIILQVRLCWLVGTGSNVSIFSDPWIIGSLNYRLSGSRIVSNLVTVNELIDNQSREWKKELIMNTFKSADAGRIL